jgi:hypothetical protein
LCTFIETNSISQANEFLKHLYNAHTKCPDLDKMNNRLLNVLNQAKKHRSGLIEELDSCKKLSDMLSNGPENANLVIFYLTEGDYTLVSEILRIWHQKFENFRFSFYLRNTALEILSKNSNVFYYDSWPFKPYFIAGGALIILICWLIMGKKKFYRNHFFGIATSERNQINERIELNNENYLETNDSDNIIHHRGVNRRVEINRIEEPLEGKINSRRMVLELLCFVLMPILICMFYFPPRPLRNNWHPEASNTLDTMLSDKEQVNSYLNENILLIEDLKKHMSVYRDKVTKEHVNHRIETKAKKNGKDEEFKEIINGANTDRLRIITMILFVYSAIITIKAIK